ncbi:quinone oxidoreductase family protein [Bacillus marinisedimentorum]|uniref:quinone oxidoreductase family protein n=1 Tax=Bacillus marinisedimentorum TaxID=1821260 RepID=UPI0007E0B26D|nr:NADPH:quinone oxidoreductase family protein [Bacillus marinisedimentorum]
MKAIQFTEYGEPEVLKLVEIEKPTPSGREVLIEIKSIGVNYADTARREGQYVVPTPLPFVPGAEVAGIVIETGKDVKNVEKGMRVTALIGSKNATGYAEYTVTDERSVIPIPDELDFNTAAAFPLQALSAYHILKTMGRLDQGESVLIHAAAGGVGSIAVQLARLFGAGKIIATASSEEKLKLAKSLGADVLVNYTKDNWEKVVKESTGGKGVDVALEMAGGDIFNKTLDCMAPFGRLVIYGVASGEQSRLTPSLLMGKNLTVSGFFLPQIMTKPELFQQSLNELTGYLTEGRLKLKIGGVYPLEEAAEVHRKLQGRKTQGKLILVP